MRKKNTTKSKKFRIRCPVCGLLVWENRLKKQHELEIVEVRSSGRGKIKNVFMGWHPENPLHGVFEKHFYDVLDYLLSHGYIDAKHVKKTADFYDKFGSRDMHMQMGAYIHPSVRADRKRERD